LRSLRSVVYKIESKFQVSGPPQSWKEASLIKKN
jgi:hypothetical protein